MKVMMTMAVLVEEGKDDKWNLRLLGRERLILETNRPDRLPKLLFLIFGKMYFSVSVKSICVESAGQCGGCNTISTSATNVPVAQTQISYNTLPLNHMNTVTVMMKLKRKKCDKSLQMKQRKTFSAESQM